MKDKLFGEYTRYQQQIASYRRVNQTAFWSWIRKHVGGHQFQKTVTVTVMSEGGYPTDKQVRPYFWAFPSIEDCRRTWEKKYGSETWTPVAEVQETMEQPKRNATPF